MVNIIFELIWYFFIYSFIGWCAEIAYAAVKHKKFMNRGFLNGPLCPVYGIGVVLILVFFSSLKGNFFSWPWAVPLWLPWWNSLREP